MNWYESALFAGTGAALALTLFKCVAYWLSRRARRVKRAHDTLAKEFTEGGFTPTRQTQMDFVGGAHEQAMPSQSICEAADRDALRRGELPSSWRVKPVTTISPEEFEHLRRSYGGASQTRTSPDARQGPDYPGLQDPGYMQRIQSESRIADICTNGGKRHNFQPRYSESSVPVVFRNLNLRQTKAMELARLIESQTTRVKAYHSDVCCWCGMVVNQQATVAEARGPNGEKVIEVHVEGEMS